MNRVASFCCVMAAATLGRGSPVDTAIVAAMKLPEARNYCWIATVQDDGRFYTIEGKTQKGGYSLVNMPMISSIQRKLGAHASELQTAIFKGDADCVIDTPDGWKTPEELTESPVPAPAPAPRAAPSRRGRGPWRGTPGAGSAIPIGPSAALVRYSNLQLNLSHPHDEVGIIVGSYLNIHLEPDGVSGTLSEDGAKQLLVHPGQNEITPLRASGTFRLWLKDGVLVKYEVQLTGTISVAGSAHWEITLHQTTVTELKAIGTTTFEVPEEAKRKLG